MWNKIRKLITSRSHRQLVIRKIRTAVKQAATRSDFKRRADAAMFAAVGLGGLVGAATMAAASQVSLAIELFVGACVGAGFVVMTIIFSLWTWQAAVEVHRAITNFLRKRRANRFNTGGRHTDVAVAWLHEHGHLSTRKAKAVAARLRNSIEVPARDAAADSLCAWYEQEREAARERREQTTIEWLDHHRTQVEAQLDDVNSYLKAAADIDKQPVELNMTLTDIIDVVLAADNRRVADALALLLTTESEFNDNAGHEGVAYCYAADCTQCSAARPTRQVRRKLHDAVRQAAKVLSSPDRTLHTMADEFARRATDTADRRHAGRKANTEVSDLAEVTELPRRQAG